MKIGMILTEDTPEIETSPPGDVFGTNVGDERPSPCDCLVSAGG